MPDTLHDVVIVGAGPVGLALGRMLGLQGHDSDARFKELGGRTLAIGPTGLADPTGAWTTWFDTHGIAAALIRPDHYVFGMVADPTEITRLTGDFADRLR
ncbi:hypothetical protein [Lentzea sp. E54]|uniref:hypothetical protein n=1 Tax=Lentzea xerophila TaxID=3435883 RepID=UPI003DA2BBE2